ncbi:hypothetical protein [Moraxella sp. CTOTU49803]|nr:hypothetical protein [Moraxella sp. CTOTU49803]
MAISTNLIKSFQLSALTTALALAGCGGGGGNDTLPPPVKTGTVSVTNPSTGTDSTTTTNLASVKKVQLVSTSSDFYMNVGDSVELTVYALNSNNIGVASVPVSVQITDPSVTGVFSGISPNLVTDDTGKAVIKLDIKSLTNDQKNYLKQNGLVVTTTVGKVSTSKTLKGTDVSTTTPTPTVTVTNLLLISDSQNITLVKGTKINVTALAVDKDNNIIPNTTIDFNIGNSVLSGIFANSNLSVLTNDRGEANLELELKSLSNEQISYLLNTGLTINSTARTGSVASNTINLKGVEQGSTTTKLDVQKVNLTTPKPNFNVQVGEKFTVTASVLNSSNTGLGGVPVQFKLDDPSATGVYAVSDTSNVVTNASGEATIELEVKSEAAKAKLLSQGINITATAKNTTGTTPVPVTGSVKLYGVDPTVDSNIAKVARVGLSTTAANNTFDLTVGNTFTVTANVVDSGQGALANVPVTFTLPGLDQTGIANLSGSTVKTDSEGKATINLSISSLNATQRDYLLKNGLQINASVPNGTPVSPLKLNTKQVSSETDINSISVIADSDNILMAAGSTVKITAMALDKNFGGLANQTLTVTIPNPSATGVFNITGSTITTDSKGEATLTLQVKSTLTAAQKQALANGLIVNVTSANGKTGQIKLTAKSVNDVVANSVTLTSNVNNIPLTVGSQFTVTATVNDAQNGVIANAPVTFSLPSLASYGVASLSASTISTNAQGQAIITLQVQSLTDAQKQALLSGFTINATSNGKQATPLTLKGVDPITRFDVKAVKVTSPVTKFNVQIGERFTVTASVLNGNNTGIGGTPVQFTLDDPALTGIYSVSDTSNIITNAKGEASIELEVKSEAAKQLLLTKGVTIKATAKNTQGTTAIDVTGATTVLGVDPTVSNNVAKVSKALLVSSVNPFELAVGNKISVTAVIADASNGKLDGVPVSFVLPALDQTGIANLSGSTVTTNSNGEAVINLEIKSLTATQRSYLATNGLVVKATVPNGTTIAPLKISAKDVATPATVETVSVTADSNNIIMAAGSHVKVTAVALDKNFGGLKGQVLTVNIPNPSLTGVYNLSGSTITTDEKGEAVIDLEVKSPLTEAQKQALTSGLNITVTSQNGKRGDIKLAAKAVNEVSVSSVTLTGDNIPLIIGSQVKVKATVLDAQRGVIKNAPVTFNLPDFATTGVASLSSSTVLTDDKGEAIIVLEVKSLTDAQKQALLNGFTINATSNGKAAPALTLKGVDTSIQRFDIKAVKVNSPISKFNVKTGERFTVTASVLNGNNTGIGGAPVQFKLEDPSVTGVYAVSDTSNIITNASGEATIELEVKSEAAKARLLSQGVKITATAKNTMGATATNVAGSLSVLGIDPTVSANVAKASKASLVSTINPFDLTVGTTFSVSAAVTDSNGGKLSDVPVSFVLPDLESSGIANLSGSTVNTDSNGQATINLKIISLSAAQRAYLLNSGFVVKANVANVASITPLKIAAKNTVVVDNTIESIALTADNNNNIIMAAGSKVKITAVALNKSFGAIAGQQLNVTIPNPVKTGVYNLSGSTITTDAKGEAVIELEVKSTLTTAQKNELLKGLDVTVTAANGKQNVINLVAKAANEVSVSSVDLTLFDAAGNPIPPSMSLTLGEQVQVRATVLDDQKGVIKNAPVTFYLPTFSASGVASLSPSTVLTDDKGEATITLQIKSLTDAQKKLLLAGYIINAASNGKTAPALTLKGVDTTSKLDVNKVNLTKSFNNFSYKVGERFTVTASALNTANTGVGGAPVQFTLQDPSITGVYAVSDTSNVITNASGEAILELEVKDPAKARAWGKGVNITASSINTVSGVAKVVTSPVLTVQGMEPVTNVNIAKVAQANLTTSAVNNTFDLTVGNTFTLTANVSDANNGKLAGVPVTFNLPGLEQTGIANLSGSTVTSDATGKATISLEITSLSATQREYLLKNGFTVNATVPNGTAITPLKLNAKQVVAPDTLVNSVSVIADSNNILMAAGSKVQLNAIALDKTFGGLANQTLNISLPNPATTGIYNLGNSTVTTDAKGEAIIDVGIKAALTAAQRAALQSGITVTVTSANGKQGIVTLFGKAVNEAAVSSVDLSANVTAIALTVGSQFKVTATVLDAQKGVVSNAPVTFNLPSRAASGVASLSPSTVVTDSQGRAVITLEVESLTDAQKQALLNGFTVNATSNGKAAPALTLKGVDTSIQRFDIKAVKVNSPISKFNVKTGERFTVTASVLNGNNTGIGGAPVQFKLEDPSVTGVYAVSDTSNIITNASGEATIELEVKSEAAKARLLSQGISITAIAKNTMGTTPVDVSGSIKVLGVDPTVSANTTKVAQATLSSTTPSNSFDLTVGNSFSVTANIADATQGALSGVPVTFSLPGLEQTGVANLSGSTVTTDAQGKATINLEIASLTLDQRNYLLANGLVVNATVPNGTKINPLKLTAKQVTSVDTLVKSVSMTADSDSILMAAGSKVKVTAVALDKNFGGIANTNLTFSLPDPATTGLYNITGSTVKTDAKGESVIELEIKSTLTEAQKAALLSGIKIQAVSANGAIGQATVIGKQVNEALVSKLTLASNVSAIALTTGTQFTITATALDGQNGALANVPVTFNLPSVTQYGVVSLSPSTITTNAQGQATITLQVQSLTDAQKQALLNGFTINATSNGKAAPALTLKGVDTSVKRLDVKSVKLTSPVNPFNIKIGERFTVTASVLNGNNTGIGGAPVEFNLLTNPSVSGVYAVSDTSNITTNASGEATIELEVKSTAAKDYLIQNGISIQAVSKNTMNTTPTDVKGNITLKGIDPSAVPVEANIALVKQGALSSSLSNNIFDLTVGTTFDITATVADANQGPLSKVPVTFSLPGLESTGIANLSGSTVTTDTQGKAVIKLRIDALSAGQRNYLLTNGLVVNATVPNGTKINPIKLSARDAGIDSVVTSIAVTADRDDILMMAGSKVHVTASALNGNFGGVPASDLTFSIPDPALTNVFNITGTTVKTDEKGEASIDLEVKNLLTASQKAYLQNGLKVKVTAPSGATGEITLKAKAVNEVSIDKVVLENFPNTPVVLSQGNEFIVMAHTVDAQNGAVTNAPVTFNLPDPTTTGIVSLSPSTVLTSEVAAPVEPMIGERAVIIPKGTAYIRLRVIDPAKAEKLIASGYMVKAASNGNVTQTLNVPLTKTPSQPTVNDIAKVNLVTDVNTLTTNNGDTINVTAQVRDAKNFSLANMPVSFTLLDAAAATGITNTTPLQATTNANGEAVLTLKVGALTPDQKYYLQTSGLSFKASAGAITSSTVTLRTQEAITANSVNSLLLTSDSAIQLAIGSKVKVTALAIDKNGAVVPNAQVSFKVPTDSGLVNNTGAVVNTNANGEATIEVEIKDLAKATTALQNGLVVTAQSGVSVGTTTVRGATSNANTQAYKLFVSPSKTILRTATDTSTLGIKVTDTNGGIKAGVPVQLQILEGINKGITFNKASNLVTDANGFVQVDLVQSDIGLVSKLDHSAKVRVIVNDGVYQQTEQTIDFTVTGTSIKDGFISKSVITDSLTDTITVSGVAVDGNGRPIANQSIQLLKDGAALTVPMVNTDSNGKFTFTVNSQQLGAATDSTFDLQARITNANATLTSQPFSLGTLTKVTATNLSLKVSQNNQTAINNEIKVETPTTVTVDLPSTVADGTIIYLTTNKGTLGTNGETRVLVAAQNGQAVFNNIQSKSPGVATLTVEYNGAKQLEQDITYITDKVAKLLVQVTNTTVSVNGETKIIASVRDINDAPVKNALVEFSTVEDASGGKLSSGTALTDASGNAVVSYFAGKNATPVNGVKISTAVKSVKLGNSYLPVTGVQPQTTTFTVQNFSAWIGFAFADKVAPTTDNIYYIRAGSIFINNSIGQPAVNQEVSISVVPKTYGVGMWKFIPKVAGIPAVTDKDGVVTVPAVPEVPAKWIRQSFMGGSTINGFFSCLSEDFNGNATLDRSEDLNGNGQLDAGEDLNNNGKIDFAIAEDYNGDGLLTPINPITVLAPNGTQILSTQTVKTDATGKLDFSIRYAKEYAQWLTATVRVTTKVDGSEFSQERDISLPVLDDDVITEDNKGIRPNTLSPFGTLVSSTMLPYCSFSANN